MVEISEAKDIIENPIYWASKERDKYWITKIKQRIVTLRKLKKLAIADFNPVSAQEYYGGIKELNSLLESEKEGGCYNPKNVASKSKLPLLTSSVNSKRVLENEKDVVIIDNNPLSIASYAEEYPQNWKKIQNSKGKENEKDE